MVLLWSLLLLLFRVTVPLPAIDAVHLDLIGGPLWFGVRCAFRRQVVVVEILLLRHVVLVFVVVRHEKTHNFSNYP